MENKKFEAGNLAHCAVYVRDMQTALDFYCGILGFEVCGHFHDDTVFLKLGSMVMEIIADGKDHREENRNEVRHLAMACKNIEALYEYLVSKGVEVEAPGVITLDDFEPRGCKYIMFRGPEQERLEFQEIL